MARGGQAEEDGRSKAEIMKAAKRQIGNLEIRNEKSDEPNATLANLAFSFRAIHHGRKDGNQLGGLGFQWSRERGLNPTFLAEQLQPKLRCIRLLERAAQLGDKLVV